MIGRGLCEEQQVTSTSKNDWLYYINPLYKLGPRLLDNLQVIKFIWFIFLYTEIAMVSLWFDV